MKYSGAEAFLVYRRYSDKELRIRRETGRPVDSPVKLFGWSEAPYAVELLALQRDTKKYLSRTVPIHEIRSLGSQRTIDSLQLQLISLKSRHFDHDIVMVTTEEEQGKFEAAIQKMFSDACSLNGWYDPNDDAIDLTRMINGLNNLRPKYAEALRYLGYHNLELNYVFDNVEDRYDDPPARFDVSKLIIYSFESVVKVLRDEM